MSGDMEPDINRTQGDTLVDTNRTQPSPATHQRAGGYVRVSQERAARNGYSLAAQEQDIRRFAEYKGWHLVEIYREEGVSGYRKDRPALDRLLADAKTGHLDVAIFPSIDRAGRSVKDLIDLDRTLHSHSVATVFLREGVDTSTPTGELFRNIMASLAEFEGHMIHERLLKGKRQKAAQGGYTGGWLPYGLRRDGHGRVVVVPAEAKVIRQIQRLRRAGKSLRWIAGSLSQAGVASPRGRAWHPSTIQGMVSVCRSDYERSIRNNRLGVKVGSREHPHAFLEKSLDLLRIGQALANSMETHVHNEGISSPQG